MLYHNRLLYFIGVTKKKKKKFQKNFQPYAWNIPQFPFWNSLKYFAIKVITSVFHFITAFLLVLYPEEDIIAKTSVKTLSNSVDHYNLQIH